jgi:hypothetical protein
VSSPIQVLVIQREVRDAVELVCFCGLNYEYVNRTTEC